MRPCYSSDLWRLEPASDDEQLGYSVKDSSDQSEHGYRQHFLDLLWRLSILAGYLALYEVTPLKYEFE